MTGDTSEHDTELTAIQESISKMSVASDGHAISLDKEPVNLVFIGHVDAGKSTLGGQILYMTGMVDKRSLEKFERESKEMNRESWYFSWALDVNLEERKKGITVECGRAVFETEHKRFNVIDAPGHKNYVPNMIGGAAQADIAILVISARKGEFETGFERGGQTREHALLAKVLGVKKIIVVINKMDDPTVLWSQDRYDECVSKLTPFLKQCGFSVGRDLDFIPISGFSGENVKAHINKSVCPWYNGPSLLYYLDSLPPMERKPNSPFMMPIAEKSKDMGTFIGGKIESGTVKKGQSLLIMPNKKEVEVAGLYYDETEIKSATCGDMIRLKLKGVEEEEISMGFVICDPINPVNVVHTFIAQLVIQEHKNILCPGYTAILHVHTLVEEVTLKKFLFQVDTKTGEKLKPNPHYVKQGQSVLAVIECQGLICLETYIDHQQLGRFTLRDEGKTVAIGIVKKLILPTTSVSAPLA